MLVRDSSCPGTYKAMRLAPDSHSYLLQIRPHFQTALLDEFAGWQDKAGHVSLEHGLALRR